jgi:hypothetical protein
MPDAGRADLSFDQQPAVTVAWTRIVGVSNPQYPPADLVSGTPASSSRALINQPIGYIRWTARNTTATP